MLSPRELFEQLNRDYLLVHKTKEDLFWTTYMATSDDHAGFSRAETDYKAFISSPQRLNATRDALARLAGEADDEARRALEHGLRGWLALFESNIIDNDDARGLMEKLIGMESELFSRNRQHVLRHLNDKGVWEDATLGMLATNLSTGTDPAARKSSYDAFLEQEQWVLDNGFLDIVRQRNAFARAQGYRDYFDYKVQKNEHMTPEALFRILDDFEQRTRDANRDALAALAARKGEDALLPYNLRFHMSGDVSRQLDPYLPFAQAVERWVHSFRRLGIEYRGAVLQLDLLERKGKYQNGFCHGPVPCFFDADGRWVAAQINFTSGAKPDQVGSGARAINTLFHEGGHAAHFANVTQNSPCFSQEFAPTSMAYAETQSMFCDSLLGDADWLKRYARNRAGEAVPDSLIRAQIEVEQPFRAFMERMLLVVGYFEAGLYRLDDGDLTPQTVLALARATEVRLLGVASPRPLLAIPHLLNQESAASYHGYLLANMAVYQTRAHFMRHDGYLCDNPSIGPQLARHYWGPGNGASHNATLLSLTGEPFNARYLADECNRSVEDAWAAAQERMRAAAARGDRPAPRADLNAHIRLVHGDELIADNSAGDEAMCRRFESWVAQRYPESID
ncbi:M3 family metallopeptidase [Paludibacterium yongneupense]|uniref:M3 family metallopeptidase n=1 Tax=Paludibacterium yongneupense TaxID=400061 RepID=UPI00040EE044|nr:M3 family metallopeptidase [Paludibacterium yongneupense]